jgi:tetratricopeptide (TPR) repeat protein
MTITGYLDAEHKLKDPERKDIDQALEKLLAGDFISSYDILNNLSDSELVDTQAFAFLGLGEVHYFQLIHQLSFENYQKAAKLFISQNNMRGKIFSHYRLAMNQTDISSTPSTNKNDLFNNAFNEANNMNDDFLIAYGHHYNGLYLIDESNFDEAIKELDRSISIREKIKDDENINSSKASKARCLAELGDYKTARQIAEQAYGAQISSNLKVYALRTQAIISYILRKEASGSMTNLPNKLSLIEGQGSQISDSLKTFQEGPEIASLSRAVMLLS